MSPYPAPELLTRNACKNIIRINECIIKFKKGSQPTLTLINDTYSEEDKEDVDRIIIPLTPSIDFRKAKYKDESDLDIILYALRHQGNDVFVEFQKGGESEASLFEEIICDYLYSLTTNAPPSSKDLANFVTKANLEDMLPKKGRLLF